MNNNAVLATLHGIAQMLPEEEKKTFDYCKKHPDEVKNIMDCLPVRIALAIADVEREIKRETAKNSGNLNRHKAAERVLKTAKASPRSGLWGAWISSDGLQNICDGFQAYRLREHLPLDPDPKNIDPIDLSRLVQPNEGETLPLPTVAELRAYIKTAKAERKAAKDKTPPLWDFGDGLPLLNAEYLLNALEILPGCTATASKHYPATAAVFFESSAGVGLICPIRRPAKV